MTDVPAPPQVVNVLILLVAVATAVALVTRRIGVPYTVGLVVAGLGLGAFRVIAAPQLTRELLFAVFLPGLVFEAALRLRLADVRRDAATIVALAVPGVVVALLLTAALLVAESRALDIPEAIGWRQGLVFGALIAATDPIAVVALFRSLAAPARLTVLIEAESLLNDGTAIVFFGLIMTATAGGPVAVPRLVLEFCRVVGIGAAVGLGLAWIVTHVSRRITDAMIEITLTMIAAYGSFAIADQLGGSGVIATVLAGLVVGSDYGHGDVPRATRATVESFWDYVAFVLNSIVFLLIGFEVHLGRLAASAPLVASALFAVLAARVVVVSSAALGAARGRHPIPRPWVPVLTWGGLRGALSMVLALSLPADFPGREEVVTVTFGVVVLSILVQGVTMSPLLRRMRLVGGGRADARAP